MRTIRNRIGTSRVISRPLKSSQFFISWIVERAEDHAAIHPEHVDRAEDGAAGGSSGPTRCDVESAEQDQKLADEAVQPRQADGRKSDYDQDRGE